MNRINGGNSSTIKSAGTYTLDGNQAVAYSRIRYTAGGDLARAGRQREVLEKIFEKGKKNPLKMMSVMDEVLPQVKTNMSQDELFKMVLSVFKYNNIPVIIIIITIIDGIAIANAILFFLGIIIFSPFKLF